MAELAKVILPDGSVVMREEPVIPVRSSTKSAVVSGIGTIILSLIGLLFPDLMNSITPDQALWIGGLITGIVAYLTTRFTKSPAKPGAI